MPAIEISQEHYNRLMAFKPVVEQALEAEMSEMEFMDFIAYSAVERLFLESAMSADLQVEAVRRGDGVGQAAVETLRMAQGTLAALSRQYPKEVFGFVAGIWRGMNTDERHDKGMGLHVLWERFKKEQEGRS